jgi:hypothetical protein
VTQSKFERGGIASGPSHERGGIKLVDGQSGAVVGEMEGGEAYMILSRETTAANRSLIEALLSESLSGRNRRLFADGGIVPASLPSVSFSREALYVPANQNGQSLGVDLQPLLAELTAMRAALAQMPVNLKAHVVYTDLEQMQEEVTAVRGFAGVR